MTAVYKDIINYIYQIQDQMNNLQSQGFFDLLLGGIEAIGGLIGCSFGLPTEGLVVAGVGNGVSAVSDTISAAQSIPALQEGIQELEVYAEDLYKFEQSFEAMGTLILVITQQCVLEGVRLPEIWMKVNWW